MGTAAAKTADKSPEPAVPELVPQAHGGALLSGGVPGNKGGGRPPNKFKNALALLRENPEVHKAIEEAATDSSSRNFKAALELMSDYDDDKPAEKRQIVGSIEVRVRFEREGRRVTAS